MPDWVYRIKSDIPWTDVTEEPEIDDATTVGQEEQAAGNHTVSGPVKIDEYTREYTLTFETEEAWDSWCNKIKALGVLPHKSGFTSEPVHPDDFVWHNRPYT